jgi:hypothetical protein
MKLVLTHATVINQVANTSATQHVLNIFTNAAEEYTQVLDILKKATDAITKLGDKDRKALRRINIVLSVQEYNHRQPINKVAVAETAIKVLEAVHPAFIKPAADADKAALLEIDAQNLANAEADKIRQAKLEAEKHELALLKERIARLENGEDAHKERTQIEIEAELAQQHAEQVKEQDRKEKALKKATKKTTAKKE